MSAETDNMATEDLLRQLRVVKDAAKQVEAEPEAAAPLQRCCDVLKLLQTFPVTADLLSSTGAGKSVRALTKHPNESIKAAAGVVVAAWKSNITKQLGKQANAPLTAVTTAAAAAAATAPTANSSLAPAAPVSAAADTSQAGSQRAQADAAPAPAAAPAPSAAPGAAPAPALSVEPPPQGGRAQAAADFSGLRRQDSDAPVSTVPRKPFAQPPPTGDKVRDAITKGLAQALLSAVMDEFELVENPHALAAAIEDAAYERFKRTVGNDYKAKMRMLVFNLKDKNNPDLRRRVVLGEIDSETLLNMTSEELASDAKRQENSAIRAAMTRETERTQNLSAQTTDMFLCMKCKKRQCTYYQMQTRSADEPMTTFVRCVPCGNRWKFC